MGKMRRLHYLSIQGNPLRPPLCEFLDSENQHTSTGNVAALHTAQVIVNFLAKLAQESTLIIGSGDHPLPVRRRGVTFENDNFDEEDEDYVNNNNVYEDTYFGGNLRRDELCVDAEMAGGHHLLQMVDYNKPVEEKKLNNKSETFMDFLTKPRSSTFPIPLVGKSSDFTRAHRRLKWESLDRHQSIAITLLVVLICIFPIIIPPLMIESSAVEKYTKDHGYGSNFYWDQTKLAYGLIESAISCVTSRPFLLKGPQGRSGDDMGPVTAMLVAFRDALMSMFEALSNMFNRSVATVV